MGNRYTRRFLRARWQNRKLSNWREARPHQPARILERNTRVLDNGDYYWVRICPIADVVWSKI
ncbi:hypothetical protein AL505_80190 [Escherichia coli]|nr:hypothetical protein AL505_80190 [Escherichia coli]